MSAASTSSGQPFWRRTNPAKPIATRSGGQPERAPCPAPLRETGGSTRVVHDRQRQPDREALRDVAVDRDRRVAPALHHRGDRARAAVAALAGERGAQMPDDLRAVAVRDHRGREQRRVVQVDDREAVRAHQPLELAQVRRERGDLAAEHEPAEALVGRVPGVREDRDLALVDGRAGVARRGRRPGPPGRRRAARSGRRGGGSAARATTAHRRAAGGGGRRGRGCARAAARSGGRSPRSAARSSPGRSSRSACARAAAAEALAPVGLGEQLGDRVRERLDAEVVDEDAGLAGDDDAAARARAGRDDRHAATPRPRSPAGRARAPATARRRRRSPGTGSPCPA